MPNFQTPHMMLTVIAGGMTMNPKMTTASHSDSLEADISVFRSRTAFQSVALSCFSCLIPRRCMMPAMPPIPRIDAIT